MGRLEDNRASTCALVSRCDLSPINLPEIWQDLGPSRHWSTYGREVLWPESHSLISTSGGLFTPAFEVLAITR